MALINRMSRLFAADLHAVLDRMEEPDVLLRHAVREMEEELARTEQAVKLLELERNRLADRQRKVAASVAQLGEQIGIALDADNEELARKLVRRKLENERLDRHVTERRAGVAKALDERAAVLAEQRERLDVLRQKAEVLAESTPPDAAMDVRPELAVGDDEVEVALLRERQRRMRS